MTIESQIQEIEKWLTAQRPDYLAELQPGATEAALATFESRFSVKLPEAFRAFYKWHDGQPTSSFESLQENRMWSSLESIAKSKEICDGMIGRDFDDPRWWRRGWIPFLSNGGGDHLCIDTTAEDGGNPGQLLEFWHTDGDRDIQFPSFEAWLGDLVESMKNGTLEWD